MTKTTVKATPYNISTFGRAYTEYKALAALMEDESADAHALRSQWQTLQPHLKCLLCEHDDGLPSMLSETHTGMVTAEEQGIAPEAAEIWDRLRVLHGLQSYLQLWLMVSAHYITTAPHMVDIFRYNTAQLIDTIWDVLCSNEAAPVEVEPWAEKVIEASCAEAEKYRAEDTA